MERINQWLLKRGISQEAINTSGISFINGRIVIPIKDHLGNFIFNKYRRDPEQSEGPKYTYEPGSIATLYNAHTVVGKHNEDIFVVEGELDCLLLNSLGFNAVSSTGGAGMFKVDWIEYVKNNNVYIIYDRDDAGIRGALKVQKMMPPAQIVFLPHDTKGKDITDYFQTHSVEQFRKLIGTAQRWLLPYDPTDIPSTKSGIDAIIHKLNEAGEEILERRRGLTAFGLETGHTDVLFEMIRNRKDYWDKQKKILGKPKIIGNDIEKAKAVPIERYIKFNINGFARCLWHDEVHGSMKYYPESGHIYCFACNVRKDVIDTVMKLYNLSFKDALNFILNK